MTTTATRNARKADERAADRVLTRAVETAVAQLRAGATALDVTYVLHTAGVAAGLLIDGEATA